MSRAAAISVDELEAALTRDDGVASVPIIVKGRLVLPSRPPAAELLQACRSQGWPAWFRHGDVQVLRQSVIDPGTFEPIERSQFLVIPDPDPSSLVESDPSQIARDLAQVPFESVLEYIASLADALDSSNPLVAAAAETTKASSTVSGRYVDVMFSAMVGMLDPAAFAAAVDRELGHDGIPGSRFLDEWVEVPAATHSGATARMAALDAGAAPGHRPVARVRAFPTRQLHITAGNSLIVPLVSMVRALATKGAAVIKSPARATAASTLMAAAIHSVGSDHPIARHLSLVYWKGGDRSVEDSLFRPEAFDRLVLWGAEQTMMSVAGRALGLKTVLLKARYGISLIGKEALAADLDAAAERVAADVLIGNQAACTAALLVYVEAEEARVLEFCEALRTALAGWDGRLPHRPSRASRGFLRRLQRGSLAHATWFENGEWTDPTSAVVYAPQPFDVSQHPMSRLAVVRPVADLADALPYVHPGVSTAGVYPEQRRIALRDELAARGVSNILPLGDVERAYAGMPHDGMRVLSELVNWTNG